VFSVNTAEGDAVCTLSLEIDENGRLICRLTDDDQHATITSAAATPAVEELSAALESARNDGYGECQWQEAAGEYRWMFRRTGERLTVVALWSSGVITGWEQVFRTECDFEAFTAMLRDELGQGRVE
jgi:hypothetical protein